MVKQQKENFQLLQKRVEERYRRLGIPEGGSESDSKREILSELVVTSLLAFPMRLYNAMIILISSDSELESDCSLTLTDRGIVQLRKE
jgi:hypothetical protein